MVIYAVLAYPIFEVSCDGVVSFPQIERKFHSLNRAKEFYDQINLDAIYEKSILNVPSDLREFVSYRKALLIFVDGEGEVLICDERGGDK